MSITNRTDRAAVARQVQRLSTLRYFQQAEEFIQEYVDTLCNVCQSPDHARRVVTHCIETYAEVPTPAELRRIAAELRPPSQRSRREDCPHCEGAGYVVALYIHTSKPGPGEREWRRLTPEQAHELRGKIDDRIGGQQILEAARRCNCMPAMPEAA